MKTFIVAVLIFAILLFGVFWNMHYLTDTLDGIHTSLTAIPVPAKEAEDLTVQLEALRGIRDDWSRTSTGISMSVNLMEAEVHLAAALAAAAADNRDNYLVALGELCYSVSHLREMSRLTVKNLI